jgi:preprotein translocase subunit SecG
MNSILSWIQIILAIIITIGILAQKSNAGLGGAFGAGNDGATTYHTKRGFEKFLFYLTIVSSLIFVVLTLIQVIRF